MRLSPTLGAVAAVVLLGIAGCSTTNGEVEPAADEPNVESSTSERRDEVAPPAATPPEFETEIDRTEAETPKEQCIDDSDPGSAENVARDLPETDDCDNELKAVTGVLSSKADVDFYRLSALDKAGCVRSADFRLATAGTEVCVYARCKNSTVDAVTGCAEGLPSTSDIGMNGCCAAAPGRAVPELDCSGLNDSADFFVRVRQINSDLCLPYKLEYSF